MGCNCKKNKSNRVTEAKKRSPQKITLSEKQLTNLIGKVLNEETNNQRPRRRKTSRR